jgi:D-alanyl-D-alanine carboxypeptidase
MIKRPFRTAAVSACAWLLAACGGGSSTTAEKALPDSIATVMAKSRYASASSKWSLVVMDAKTGAIVHALDPDRLAFTGSVRKLFSIGAALNSIGPDHRFTTTVHRTGAATPQGALTGDLVLVGAGDLTFGGRAKPDGTFAYTDFDHNEAPAFGGAGLTPQDPLAALDDLARQVRAAGIRSVSGDVLVDDRLFDSFRVPNGNVLISPISLNENLIDVSVTPGPAAGDPALLDWRPKLTGFTVEGGAVTTAAGSTADVLVSGDAPGNNSLSCLGAPGCRGIVSGARSPAAGTIPSGYQAPVIGTSQFVGVLRAEDPTSLARIAFIDALTRAGITVAAPVVGRNRTDRLPPRKELNASTLVATYVSPPYLEYARLILKVSLNTGANLSLMHVGLSQGERTREGALAAERRLLVDELGLDPAGFEFPTNGSGSPDSRASARTTAKLAAAMSKRPGYAPYRQGLPLLGVDGSLAAIGRTVVGKEHIAAKSGATVDAEGNIAAISMAGYIDAKSGRALTFALFVNDAGPLTDIGDTLQVFEDQAQIAGIVYEMN